MPRPEPRKEVRTRKDGEDVRVSVGRGETTGSAGAHRSTDGWSPEPVGGSEPEPASGPEPEFDGTRPAGPVHHHRIRTAMLVVAAVVVLGAAVVVASFVLRDPPGAKSLGSATRQFLASTTTRPAPHGFVLPPAGVYRVSGHGTEKISAPPDSQADSALMPVTVSYLGRGCWRWHLDYNTAHWNEYDFCPQGSRLLLTVQRNYLAWNLGLVTITNLARFDCVPPGPIVVESPTQGQTFVLDCTGTNTAVPGPSSAAGKIAIIGVESVDVGGMPVRAIHMTWHQTITGGQSGELDESWWFAVDTGMPLKASRSYRLVTNSSIGLITYTESGSWQLDGLAPRA